MIKFFNLFKNIFTFFQDFINSFYFILFLSIIVIIYFLIAYYVIDRKKIKKILSYKEIGNPTLRDLRDLPLVNIIIPAWKENEIFRGCLLSITKLTYPNLKIIVNAGGNEETINIANDFKKYANFVILKQEKGGGKIKAINDSLAHVSEGLVYFIDSDIFLNNDIFIRMLHAIINENRNIVVSLLKPHKSQENIDFVKYVYINRYAKNKNLLRRYLDSTTPHTCLNYEVIKSINKFPEKQLLGDGSVIGIEIINKGYEIYRIHQFVESFNFPDTFREYLSQNVRWIELTLVMSYRKNKKLILIKLFYILASIYLLVFPFLIFINLRLFIIGIFLFLIFYLSKIRKVILFKITEEKRNGLRIRFVFFLKLLYYIYIDIIINIYAIFELIFYKKKFRERKNISKRRI